MVLRPIPPLSMPEFPAANVSHTEISSPPSEDVLPVSCHIPPKNCCHCNETFRFLLNCMDCWFFLFSTAPHKGKPWSECMISNHQQQRSNSPSALTFSMSLGKPPHLTVRRRWQSWAWLLAGYTSFPERKSWVMPRVVTRLTRSCGQKISVFLVMSNLQWVLQPTAKLSSRTAFHFD